MNGAEATQVEHRRRLPSSTPGVKRSASNDVPERPPIKRNSAADSEVEKREFLAGSVVVVIPAYNEARTIAELVDRTLKFVRDVIVVDDGSTDNTASALSDLPVNVLRHASNRGKGASLISGFRAAIDGGASAVITLDGDGQHRPEDIPRFIERAKTASHCIIVGNRLADRTAIPLARYRANRFANFWISWACGYRIDDSQSGFRLYPRLVLEAAQACQSRHHDFVFESEILINAARHGYRSVAIEIPALYSGAALRPSHFRPVADITRIVLMVAWKLISRGMYPQGLVRYLREGRQ